MVCEFPENSSLGLGDAEEIAASVFLTPDHNVTRIIFMKGSDHMILNCGQ